MKAILRYCVLPIAAFLIAGKLVIWMAQKYPITFISVISAMIVYGLVHGYIARKRNDRRGWRIGSSGRDEIYYEEKIEGGWERITVYAEMLTGEVRRLIYLSSIQFPPWATNREDDIIERIKSEFPPPRYEFQQAEQGGGGNSAALRASP